MGTNSSLDMDLEEIPVRPIHDVSVLVEIKLVVVFPSFAGVICIPGQWSGVLEPVAAGLRR